MNSRIAPHIINVCKIGQGAACCRYLLMAPTGFECGKLNPNEKATLDARVHGFTAKSDNCEGQPPEVLNIR